MSKHLCLLLVLLCFSTIQAQKPQTITEKVAGMQQFPGFFPFYWDAKAGKLWLEIDKGNTEFLYVESLPAGIGSTDNRPDRGTSGRKALGQFQPTGPRGPLV